ncbi:hypothetical protein [Microcystis phage MJing1]|nr:hypothetical protein [Microcystis phage MJing1]
MSEKKPATKSVKVGPGRLSFPALLEPEENDQGKLKYGTTILLPPDYDTKPLLDELWRAWKEKFGQDPKKWPKGSTVRTPDKVIRDASEKPHLAGYEEGWSFISARADNKPGVVDAMVRPVTEKREVYPGRWAYITVNAYCYTKPTTGVTFGLNNVQLLRDDTPFGGAAPKAETEFDTVAEEMEQESALD